MLTAKAKTLLASPDVPKVALVTLSLPGDNPSTLEPHLAERGNTIRLASGFKADVEGAPGKIPFDPHLRAFPDIEQGYFRPEIRATEVAEGRFHVTPNAGLAEILSSRGYGAGATGRIDLWMPGLALPEVLPLVAGPLAEAPQFDERSGGVDVTITDGDQDRHVNYPPDFLSPADFPLAPESVFGVGRRQVIIGDYPEPVDCPQIAPNECYLQEPPGHADPAGYLADGVRMTSHVPRVEQRTMPTSGIAYDVLVFDVALTELGIDGQPAQIKAFGGTGQVEASPIVALLEVIGGYRMTPEARMLAVQSPFALAFLMKQGREGQADVLSIVRDRLIPQTDLVFGWRQGAVHLFRLHDQTPEITLGIGQGLLYRMDEPDPLTPLEQVFDTIVVQCGKSSFDGEPLKIIRRDAYNGPHEIREVLSRAPRHGELTVPAFDLFVDTDREGNRTCLSGERLGDAVAMAHAQRGRRHRYKAEWLEGMAVDIGYRARLNDARQKLVDRPARIVYRRFGGSGQPELVFLTTVESGELVAS